MNETGKHQSEQEALEGIVSKLEKLRDAFKDEIPEEMLSGASPDKNFKVRGNWFQGVMPNVEELLYLKGIQQDDEPEIQELLEYFDSEEFHGKLRSRTDASDVEKGNKLISLALDLVEK